MRKAAIGIVVLCSSLMTLWPQTVQAGSTKWVAPTSSQAAIASAYEKSGGKGGLGTADGDPSVWGTGCVQSYSGGRARSSAIIVNTCASTTEGTSEKKPATIRSQVVRGEFWDYAKSRGSGALGSPLGNDQILDGGRWQTFSGGEWGLTDIYQSVQSDTAYAVREHMREWHQNHGGVSGKLGWPTSEEYSWEGETRQDFQFGSLVWRAETGTRPLVSWSNGQVLSSPTVDPAHYIIRELGSLKISSTEQLNRCYGGKSAAQAISPDDLSLTQKRYPSKGTAPDCVTPREQAAITWATAQLQSKNSAWSNQINAYWSGRCETFVELAFGTRMRAFSAAEHYQWRLQRGQIHRDTVAPAGAVVFYGGSSDGHTGISLGNGLVISTQGYIGDTKPIWQHQITGLTNPYLGWAYIDDSWPR